jgi:hypothetical protein
MPPPTWSTQSWRSRKNGTAKHRRYYDTAYGKWRLAKDIRNIMRTHFQSQHWITQQDIEDVLFKKRNRPNGFDIISTLEDFSFCPRDDCNEFEHRATNISTLEEVSFCTHDGRIVDRFEQRHWWRIKLDSQTRTVRTRQPATTSTTP